MTTRKYEFTGEEILHDGRTLRRIRLLLDGKVGGWIEKEENLSHEGACWVYGDARVYDNARVYGEAWVSGNAWVYDNARVYGDAWVYDNARVYGDARVYDNARVYGEAWVYGDAWVYDNARVYGNSSATVQTETTTTTTMTPHQKVAMEIGTLLGEKQAAYGDAFSRAGEILAILYPNGLRREDMHHCLTIARVIDKLFRVARAGEGKDPMGENPWRDVAGYAILSAMRSEGVK